MSVGSSEQYKIMTTNKKIKVLTKTEIYNKLDENSKRTMYLLDQIRCNHKNGCIPRVLLDEFTNHFDNHILPMYCPGGIYHFPKKHKGLRLDNIEYLEGKGQNVN